MLGIGIGIDAVTSPIAAGGGGGSYTAQAVHNDGTALMVNNALTGAGIDNSYWSASYWFKGTHGGVPGSSWPYPMGYLLILDPDNSFAVNIDVYAGANRPTFTEGLISPSFDCFSADSSSSVQGDNPTAVSDDEWHHHIVSVDTSHPAGSRVVASYIDGVREVGSVYVDYGPAFTMSWSGQKVTVFDDGSGFAAYIGDVAELWCAPGQLLLDENGDIPPAMLAKFRSASGKPVDLGADGSLPTGTAPALFFSGDATSFSTNRGTGGSFAFTGTLTDATTSPSD